MPGKLRGTLPPRIIFRPPKAFGSIKFIITKLQVLQWLATLTFVDGLVNPTTHLVTSGAISKVYRACDVEFTSPSTKVRVANHLNAGAFVVNRELNIL